MTGYTFFVDLPFDKHLGGNTCMIAARLPQCVVAKHAVVTNQGIHDGVLKRVTHMQCARHIGRGNHDAVRFAVTLRSEIAVLFPGAIPALFDCLRVVCFIHPRSVLQRQASGQIQCAFQQVAYVFS